MEKIDFLMRIQILPSKLVRDGRKCCLKTKTDMKRPKTGRMEVRRDGEDRFFDEESDFEVEIGAGWPKMIENGFQLYE